MSENFTRDECHRAIAADLQDAGIDAAYLDGPVTPTVLDAYLENGAKEFKKWLSLEGERCLRSGVPPLLVANLAESGSFAVGTIVQELHNRARQLIGQAAIGEFEEQAIAQSETAPSWYTALEGTDLAQEDNA